jgi:hypothetical protein
MAKPPKGFRDISTTYQVAYATYGGDVQVRKIGDRLWEVLPRGKSALYETSKGAALDRALLASASRSAHSTMKDAPSGFWLKDRLGGRVWLNVRDGHIVGAMGSDPKRFMGLSIDQARHLARYGGSGKAG